MGDRRNHDLTFRNVVDQAEGIDVDHVFRGGLPDRLSRFRVLGQERDRPPYLAVKPMRASRRLLP